MNKLDEIGNFDTEKNKKPEDSRTMQEILRAKREQTEKELEE